MNDYITFFVCLFLAIFVHETGHLIAAIICKVKVEAFSLGFGKILWHKTIKGIDFRISLLPFGGYTKLAGEQSDEKNGFLAQPYRKKFLILIAGVGCNFLLACLCYLINWKSILTGLRIDLQFLQYCYFKDSVKEIIISSDPNWFVFKLGALNLLCAILNILPIPALDGGHLVWVWIEKLCSKNFIKVYTTITQIGFVFLIIIQIVVLYLCWSKR